MAAAIAGCRANAGDVQAWKRTERGPTKLAALVGSPRYEPELRASALLALATMDVREAQSGTEGLDPVRAVERSVTTLRERQDPALAELIAGALPGLEFAMRGTASGEPSAVPTPDMSRAKDAAVVFARASTGPTRERLVRAIMAWFAVDYARRATEGEYDADECALEFGPSAAALLLPAIGPRLDKDAQPRLARVLAERGDASVKAQAAERFVAAGREMETDAFRTWIDAQVRSALAAAGATPAENRIGAVVIRTREGFITQGAIAALKPLATEAVARDRLLEIARTRPQTGNEELDRLLDLRRVEALSALAERVGPEHASALLDLGLDANNSGAVRELAFDRVADTRSSAVMPRLHPLVGAPALDGEPDVGTKRQLRARAAELLLELGAAPSELFARLPQDPTVPFEPAELEGYANRLASRTPPPSEEVRRELDSPVWWRRVVALHFVAKTGTAADVALLESHVADALPTLGAGFRNRDPAQDTVGKVAAAALASLRERLAQPPAN